MIKQSKQAFTLVELIVVITILAILGTIAFISLQGYSKSARDSRRVSDIQNIRKSLELFTMNTSKYPLPDDGNEVSFSGELIWTQGILGDNVTQNLSRNLNEKPLDPLTGTEYTYSTVYNELEYEILSYYESDILSYSNILNQAQAETVIPKVDGTYNQVYVETETYIVPTPSIINAEASEGDIILSNDTIDSQIISGGTNTTDYGTNESSIDGLSGLELHTVSKITEDSSTGEIIAVANAIQLAYSGSLLASDDIYQPILSATTEGEKYNLVEIVVLNTLPEGTNGVCGTDNGLDFTSTPTNLCSAGSPSNVIDNGIGSTYYWTCVGTNGGITDNSCNANHIITRYPGCNTDDITIGDYTIAACNVGTSTAGVTSASYGNYYQFGRNTTAFTPGNASYGNDRLSPGGVDAGSANLWGVEYAERLTATYLNQNEADQLKMKGPCAIGYHVPTYFEFSSIITTAGWSTLTGGPQMISTLKLPQAGHRLWSNGGMNNVGENGWYALSSDHNLIFDDVPYGFIGNVEIILAGNNRSTGLSIRCFKN